MTKIEASNFFRFLAFNSMCLARIFRSKFFNSDLFLKKGSEKKILQLNFFNIDIILNEGDSLISEDSISVDYTSDRTLIMDEDIPTRLIHRVTQIQSLAEEAALTGNQELTKIVQEDIKTLIEGGDLEDVENIEDFKEKLTQADNVTRVESAEERKEQISEMRGYQKDME